MACNCNEEGKCYNISMGCVVPVIANADAYYTKSEVDKKIDDIVISGGGVTSGDVQIMILKSISGKANLDDIPTDVSAFVNDVPYLTEHQSLSGYATEQWVENQHYLTEHQSLSGYATEQWVEDKNYITGVDLSNYALKSEIPTIPNNVSAFINDVPYLTQHQSLSGYATEQWVENKHYITGVDLSNYALKSEIPTVPTNVSAFVNDAGYLTQHQSLSGYATEQYVQNYTYDKQTIDDKVAQGGTFDPTQYYNTAHTYNKTEVDNMLDTKLDATAYTPTDLTDYATHQWVEDKHYITGVDLSNYALKSEIPTVPTNVSAFVNDAGYLTQHQSLSGYATEQWVEDQHYLTEHQSLSGYATEQWVEDKHYITGVDLSNYALKSEIPTVPTSNTAFTNDAGYITSSALDGYATSGDVTAATADMATQTWVGEQGFLTEHQSLDNYYTKSETSGATQLSSAFDTKADTATTLAGYGITDAYTKSETSGATQLSTAFDAKADTATTLGGYGITDAYTKSETSGATQLSTAFANKADTATTLAGYGITDAYTKSETSGATQLSSAFDAKQDTSGMTAYTTTATTDALNTVVTNHIDNTTIHVTPNDKDYWNARVDSIVANSDSSIAYPSTKAVYNEFQMKSVIVYTGNTIVGQSGNIFSSPTWHDLTGVDLSSYKYIKVFLSISKHNVGVSTNNITAPCIVEVHLDNGYAISDLNGYYAGGNITTCVNNDNRLFGVTVLVNKTANDVWQIALKTVSLYGTSSTDITNSYIYKIEAYGEDSLESVLTKCVPLTATTTSGTTIIAPNNLEQISGQLTQKTTKQGEMLANSTAITAVNISQCVTQIGYQAFAPSSSDNGNYSNLAYVEIPSGVIRIETAAFRTIYSDVCHLSTVICHAEVPPYLGYQVFSTEGNLHIHVPSGSVNAYKEAWIEYADRIYPIT